MSSPDETPTTRAKMGLRKVGISINVLVSLVMLVLLWLMVNYFASNRYVRIDLSRAQFYQLSEKSLNVLAALKRPVEVIVFVQHDDPGFLDIEGLLKEYMAKGNNRVKVRYVDPDRHPEQAELIINTYRVPRSGEAALDDLVIFAQRDDSQPGSFRRRFVYASQLSEKKERGLRSDEAVFYGEQYFTSALYSLASSKRPVVYFLEGHGEKLIDNVERIRGFSDVAHQLRRENIEVRRFAFGEGEDFPDDCDALVIAGPTAMLPQSELEVIQQYLDREGRLFAMLDSLQETGLEDLLLKWNIHVGYNVLIDPQSSSFSQKDIYIRTYGDHPITRNLNGVSTIFYSPCSVKPIVEEAEDGARPVDRPWVEELVSCSASGWAESDPSISPAVLDENKDEKGPISLAVAAERGPGEEVEVSVRPTRLVVVGDSDFASNGLLRGGSIDFFLSSINWLLDRDELLAISSKPIYASPLRMSQDELNQLFLLTVVAIPASGALLGFIVWMRRRA